MLRAQLAASAPPTTSTQVAPVSSSTATNSDTNFPRDLMAVMNHIMPGNDEVQQLTRRYTAQCIKDGEHPPIEVQHSDNVTYIVDTASEFNLCSFEWLKARRLEGAASRMLPTTPGVAIDHCGHFGKSLGYCAEGYTITIIGNHYVPLRWHACAWFTMGPTLGRATLENLEQTSPCQKVASPTTSMAAQPSTRS